MSNQPKPVSELLRYEQWVIAGTKQVCFTNCVQRRFPEAVALLERLAMWLPDGSPMVGEIDAYLAALRKEIEQ